MILDDILKHRREQLAREKAQTSPAEMERLAAACRRAPRDFMAAITAPGLNVISEVKKASPSKGVISADFRPVETAVRYEKNGAAAISVLTEERYFMGSGKVLRDIRAAVELPLLRKDFIFDPYQIYEARALGADAVLLIAAALGAEKMRELRELAEKLGLVALCESHDRAELELCREAGAKIFGINNRNLKTFEVSLSTTAELAPLVPEGAVVVSESGIFTAEDALAAKKSGARAVLVGESLMRDPTLLPRLKEAGNEA